MGASRRTSERAVQRYLLGLGSNRRHARHGSPRAVLRAALEALEQSGIAVVGVSRVVASRPVGPSDRVYANAVASVSAPYDPPEMLRLLKRIERQFGRRTGGQRWASRVLDLDLVLWSGGSWADADLVIPHVQFRGRTFVLAPALSGVGSWRDPITNLGLRHLHARLTRPRPVTKPRHT